MNYALLDTNTFLHYQNFTEIDWNLIFKSEEVTLILSITVIKELDDKKNYAKDIKIRNRAKRVLATLNDVTEQIKAFKKPKTYLEYIPTEPKIDWNTEELDSLINDDRIIATCLEISREQKNITLITADLGLKLKAKSKSIQTLKLEDNYLLKEESSKEQKEISDLKLKLKTANERLPNLSLKLSNKGEQVDVITYEIKQNISFKEIIIEKKINDKINDIIQLADNKITKSNPIGMITLGGIDQVEIDRFNKDIIAYETTLQKYYLDSWKYNDKQSRLLKIDFLITNTGSSPGEDIDVNIHFPDGFKIIKFEELPTEPIEPESPPLPMTFAENFKNSIGGINYMGSMDYNFSNNEMKNISSTIKNISGPSIKKTNSYDVDFHIKSLKHKSNYLFDSLYLYFENYSDIKSFSVNYYLLAANYPEKFEGKLNIIVILV